MRQSKYNVDKNIEKRTCDGIVFASALEMRYYRDVVRPRAENGEIVRYELQKKYELQPKFKHNGKTVLPIHYVADFYIEYADGTSQVIDTKGKPDELAKLKRKLFWMKYPDLDYRWVTFDRKRGGWLEYEEVQAMKKEEAKEKKKNRRRK